MEKNKDFLGTQPVGKLLFKLAIPTVIAQLINMLYNIVDRIFIGHIPDAGSLALTGVGVTMPIIMIVSAFAGLVSSGITDIVAKSLGSSNPYNMVRATFDALSRMTTPAAVAAKRGKTLEEIFN